MGLENKEISFEIYDEGLAFCLDLYSSSEVYELC